MHSLGFAAVAIENARLPAQPFADRVRTTACTVVSLLPLGGGRPACDNACKHAPCHYEARPHDAHSPQPGKAATYAARSNCKASKLATPGNSYPTSPRHLSGCDKSHAVNSGAHDHGCNFVPAPGPLPSKRLARYQSPRASNLAVQLLRFISTVKKPPADPPNSRRIALRKD